MYRDSGGQFAGDCVGFASRRRAAASVWSQYLEVGLGPEPEVFSQSQAMSAVGFRGSIALRVAASWTNSEPVVALGVSGTWAVTGATVGYDVNRRDGEGRSALLLGKVKDNNASCAIGPMLRLFDTTYGMENIRTARLRLTVTSPEDFEMDGASSMSEISRDPEDLVRATYGARHQYPDGFMLMLGMLFAPTKDRDEPGGGFTHEIEDVASIRTLTSGGSKTLFGSRLISPLDVRDHRTDAQHGRARPALTTY